MAQPKTKEPVYVAVQRSNIVMRGFEFICRACSNSMARRIARALNEVKPNSSGH